MSIKTKFEAIIALIAEARNDRCSTAGAKRVVKAARILGRDDEEIVELLFRLDYCDVDGNPYSQKTDRVW